MRTLKQNIVILEKDDRIEIQFNSTDLDQSKCSIYINPSEGEIVLKFGDIEIIANSIPAPETWGAFYFPVDRTVLAPDDYDRSEIKDGYFGMWICNKEGMKELDHTPHQGVNFLTYGEDHKIELQGPSR